ncbi:MAG TPA: TIR domain-containing protein, partial [Chloroflexota bacterium]|nr:TIR domain-containing protein [Chloroflexota bacterium]
MQSVTRTPVLTDYVYLCHAPADHQFVLDLDEALKTRGVATFAPIADGRTTRGTGNRETARGPAEARALIFVLSPASTTSDECRRELEEASRNHIPVLVIERGSLEPALTPPEVTNLSSVLMQDGSDFFATIDNAIVPWVETVPDRQSRSARVFISYSRKNKEQVQELVRELKEQQVEVWVDWEDIPAGLPWRQEVADAILASDATLFLISRHSVVSAECGNEIQYALENNKRLITVKLDDVDDVAIPPPLREINYIPWFDGCDRAEGLRKLVYAARYDLLWVRQHTRWLQRAQEWQDRRRERPKAIGITAPPLLHLATSWAGTWRANRASKGSLLRGAVLFDAEDWLKHYTNHEPSPTDLQRLYIRTSRRAENYAHRMAIAAIGVAVIVVILAVAAAAITREAEINSMDQQAQQALVNLRNNPEASVGEAAGAVKTLQFLHADTSAATSALRQVLAGSHIRAVLRQDKGTLWSATMNPQGTLVATAGDDGKAFLWNWRTGKSIRLHARNLNEFTAAFSPDGRLVAVGGYLAHRFEKRQFYGLLQVFDTRTGKERMADETHSVHEIYQVAFSHDGRWLAAATLHGVWAQNVSRGGNFVYFLGQGSNDEMDTVQFSRDGRYVVTASADGAARVWRWSDPGHLAAIYRCAGKSDAMKQAVFSPDGKTVAVGCGSGAVALWHWQSGTFTTLRGQTSFINAVAFSPD